MGLLRPTSAGAAVLTEAADGAADSSGGLFGKDSSGGLLRAPTAPNGGETNGPAVNWLYGDTGALLNSPYEFPEWKEDGAEEDPIED